MPPPVAPRPAPTQRVLPAPVLPGNALADRRLGWVTVINPWQNQFDYETLQGVVSNSHISRIDNFINHYHQDQKFDVSPDPKYRRLLSAELRNDIFTVEVEWEHNEIPESFWPSPG